MITIVSTSVCGKMKKTYLLENFGQGRLFEVGQAVETTKSASWFIGEGKKGKIVGFNRPNREGRTSEVLKVLLEGKKQPRDLKMEEVRIIKG